MQANNSVQLDETLRQRVREFAQASGKSETVVVQEAVEKFLDDQGDETLYDRAMIAGLIGCLPDTPSDLSTNKDHFEGFGRD